MWPVFVRELRCASRVGGNYWLRTFGAGLLLVSAVLATASQEAGPPQGTKLFAVLHRSLACAIWILVPIVTADCIARERREGTLDLLFLTPLRASEVVTAKSLIQALRAVSVWLAAVPVLSLPLLMGGVSLGEATVSFLTNTASLVLALSAGIWASARSRHWWRASFAALATALFFMGCFSFFFALATSGLDTAVDFLGFDLSGPEHGLELIFCALCFLFGAVFNEYLWASVSAQNGAVASWNTVMAFVTVLSVLTLMTVILRTGRYLRGSVVRTRIESSIIDRTGCSRVVFTHLYRSWTRWKLNRNPIGWLEQRSWTSRMTMWIWLSIIMGVSLGALATQTKLVASESLMFNRVLGWGLVLTMAIVSAGSFLRERENGVLSLLLIAPLRVGEIIAGRLTGIWSQFSLAVIFLLASWFYLFLGFWNRPELVWIFFFAVIYLSLPAIGLYFSLAGKGFFAALCWTLAVAVGLPCLWLQVTFWAFEHEAAMFNADSDFSSIFFSAVAFYGTYGLLLQLAIAGFLVWRLARKLATRQFHYV